VTGHAPCGLRFERIELIHFLAGCCKRWLKPGSVGPLARSHARSISSVFDIWCGCFDRFAYGFCFSVS